MRVRLASIVLIGALVLGELMHLLAGLAGHPNCAWIQWVVNWGALWLVVPFLAGRRAGTRGEAAIVGGAAAVIEMAIYYGPSGLVSFKLVWMACGAAVASVIGVVACQTRSVRRGWLLIPALLVAEPVIWTGLFALLGRPTSVAMIWSGVGEAVTGVLLGIVGLRAGSVLARDLKR
ncbi:MAG: hypothetical protein JWQ32_2939 [Marmoricola sp.]|nr:hypothetical protein [Marmoricola sp.]